MKTKTLIKNFGKAVAAVRASKGMTQAELARKGKLHHASIVSNTERATSPHGGAANPTITTMHGLANGLGVKLTTLLKLAEHPQGPAGAMREL